MTSVIFADFCLLLVLLYHTFLILSPKYIILLHAGVYKGDPDNIQSHLHTWNNNGKSDSDHPSLFFRKPRIYDEACREAAVPAEVSVHMLFFCTLLLVTFSELL